MQIVKNGKIIRKVCADDLYFTTLRDGKVIKDFYYNRHMCFVYSIERKKSKQFNLFNFVK